jgi:hypothetical protein
LLTKELKNGQNALQRRKFVDNCQVALYTESMTDLQLLSKFAVQVSGVRMPGNWDRPLGYEGCARFVTLFWDQASNDVFITDGLTGSSAGAWWLYTNLVDQVARQEILGALMACGVHDPVNDWPLGDAEHEATFGLILDRYEHTLWVMSLGYANSFLQMQHQAPSPDWNTTALALVRQQQALQEEETIGSFTPCDCDRGWILSGGYYVPCPKCLRSGRIEVIPNQVIL